MIFSSNSKSIFQFYTAVDILVVFTDIKYPIKQLQKKKKSCLGRQRRLYIINFRFH